LHVYAPPAAPYSLFSEAVYLAFNFSVICAYQVISCWIFSSRNRNRWTWRSWRDKCAATKGSKGNIFWSLAAFISGLLRINVNDLHTVHTHELISWVRKVTSAVAQLQSSSRRALAIKICLAFPC